MENQIKGVFLFHIKFMNRNEATVVEELIEKEGNERENKREMGEKRARKSTNLNEIYNNI